jgi:hypothetical protein
VKRPAVTCSGVQEAAGLGSYIALTEAVITDFSDETYNDRVTASGRRR